MIASKRVKNVLLAGILLAASLLSSVLAFAQEESLKTREATPGRAITAGYGYEYAGYGAALEYYTDSHFALLAGVGYFPPVTMGVLQTDPGYGFDFGIRGVFGRHHRFIADLEYGFAGEAVSLISGVRTSKAFNGITAAAGYQFVGGRGFMIQATLGATWLVGADQWINNLLGSPVVTFNVGIGYKTS